MYSEEHIEKKKHLNNSFLTRLEHLLVAEGKRGKLIN